MSRFELLKYNAELIVKLINDNTIFSSKMEIKIIKPTEKSSNMILFFLLDKDNYSDTLYFANTDTGSLKGKVLGVYSNVGNKIGSFLLQLQLLLMFISNVTLLNLDNYTNEPARAARGIYSDFSIKKRGSPANWVGKDLAEQLLMADGEMVYKPTAESRKIIEQKLREIVYEQKAKGQPLPFWNNFDGIESFIRNLRQFIGGKNHRHQSRKKRRSLNKKHKRSKSNSKTKRYRK
jgi:hypothetical protein